MKNLVKLLAVTTAIMVSHGATAKTLNMLWWSDGPEGEVMKAIAEDYKQKTGGEVEINLINVAYNDVEIKLKSMLSAGKPPALSRVAAPKRFANFAVDLSNTINADDFYKTLEPNYIQDGKVLAAPMDVTINGLIYNKTLFDRAGVKVPMSPDEIWTWEQYEQAIKTVMDKGGARYGVVFDFTAHRYSTILYQYGGKIISEDGRKTVFNSPESIVALTKFKEIHDKELAPRSVWLGSENPNTLFRSGAVATHLSGSWMLSNYKDIDNFEWGVTYLPKGTQRSSVPGGKYIMAFNKSGVEKEAAEFIDYLSSKEVNARYSIDSSFISARKDNTNLDYRYGKEMFKIFSNELAATGDAPAKDWSNSVVMPKVEGIVKQVVSQTIQGKYTPEEAVNAFDKEAKYALRGVK